MKVQTGNRRLRVEATLGAAKGSTRPMRLCYFPNTDDGLRGTAQSAAPSFIYSVRAGAFSTAKHFCPDAIMFVEIVRRVCNGSNATTRE